ncbi:MAG: hypothetical protein HYR85_08615 [Planctomycetes bacterium]|nr:hypothetical protein [Planctomycetota bacterium]MBI3846912.1 hypothetical protein [Planctomycetota bacterium]
MERTDRTDPSDPMDRSDSGDRNRERGDASPPNDCREDRVREIQRLVRANRYDFENKLPIALTRLMNDVVE